MAKQWSDEKINKMKIYFSKERTEKRGNFTEFTVRVYYNICLQASLNDGVSCTSSSVRWYKINKDIYDGIYDKPDHASQSIIDDCMKHLKQMGYIKFQKLDDKWYIFLISPLDFLLEGEHEYYLEKYNIYNELKYCKEVD